MQCKKCGADVTKGAKFCPFCGAELENNDVIEENEELVEESNKSNEDNYERSEPSFASSSYQGGYSNGANSYSKRDGIAIAALIVAFISFTIPGLFIVAIILGIIGLGSNRRILAKVGIIAGAVSGFFTILMLGIIIPTTIAVINRQKKNDAIKKAERVYSVARNILMEAEFQEDSLGGYVTIIGGDYSVTVTSLMSHGDLQINPFEDGGADGGMTVHLNATTGRYSCNISGTINGYDLAFNGFTFVVK